MSRIIQTGDTPAKRRNAHMRSCAEVLRLLAERQAFDDEAQDMAAFFVFNLRGIHETIEASADVWDERGYWKKSEKLRADWRWTRQAADALEDAIRRAAWPEVPALMLALLPHFAQVTVNSITRDADWWCGARRALLAQKPD